MANKLAVEAKNIMMAVRRDKKFIESIKSHRRNGRPPY
jgi:hypothetical protein